MILQRKTRNLWQDYLVPNVTILLFMSGKMIISENLSIPTSPLVLLIKIKKDHILSPISGAIISGD